MKSFALIFTMVTTLTPVASYAAAPRASDAAEHQLWEISERLALALPGDARDVAKVISASTESVTASGRVERRATATKIGPFLTASNAVVAMGESNRADSVSFNLTGSCVPIASLRKQYPNLIVMDYARGDGEHQTYTFGTQIGDAIIAYSFPAKRLGCMTRVEVTPAATTKAKLGIK
jgi:hypothetical protein